MIKGCKETFFIACVGVFEMIRIFNYYLAPERDYKFPFKISKIFFEHLAENLIRFWKSSKNYFKYHYLAWIFKKRFCIKLNRRMPENIQDFVLMKIHRCCVKSDLFFNWILSSYKNDISCIFAAGVQRYDFAKKATLIDHKLITPERMYVTP